MKPALFTIVVLAVLFGIIAAGVLREQKTISDGGKPIIRIGATLPLTGDVAFAGIPAQKAIRLALDDIKAEKNLKYDYELVFENDQMTLKQGILNAIRLKSLNNINAILSMWLVSPGLTDWANKNQVIHMGCSWGYQTARGLYNFNHCNFPEEQTALLIRALKERNISRIGIAHHVTKTHEELVQFIAPELKKAGIEVVFKTAFYHSIRDFRIDIEKMKGKNAEIVLVLMDYPGLVIFAKQVKEQGYQVPLTTFEDFNSYPEYFEGYWFIADAVGTAAFMETFNARTREKSQSCTANLYDGLRILVEGYEKTPVREGHLIPANEDVAQTILNLKNIRSVMGDVRMDADGNIHVQPVLRKIKNGKVVGIDD
ncbi:MAG: ABC transporter substrate-binding protein [Alphaproteobacteria bacterium]|nr:ABC transporter substrate-binding protein [Alphaproteobacteria bacterium]